MTETNFKHTDLGLIPHDWEVKELGELLTICNGRDYKHLPTGNVPVYGTGGVIAMVSDYLHDGETICIGRKGTIDKPQYHKGKIWTVDTLFYTKDFFANPLFLFYKCKTVNWLAINEATGVPSLTSKNIVKVNVTLPPTLAEQERIAGALSSIDNLISALTEQIEKKRHIKQGAMQQLFPRLGELTPRHRLPGFDGKWREMKLGELGDVCMCKRIMKDETSPIESVPFYKIGTFGKKADAYIPEELFREYKQKFSYPTKGDILFSAAGTIGRYVEFDGEPAYFQDSNIVWIANDESLVCNSFLKCVYSMIEWNVDDGGVVKRLYNDSIRKTSFSAPPTIAEQSAIAAVLSRMDTEIAALEQKRDKYIAIKSGMMQNLLTGKIRLV